MIAADYEALLNTLYKPSAKVPSIVTVPLMSFVMIDGRGDPNTSKDFEDAISALYAVSYGVKFLPKKGTAPEGYFDYRVSALEGVWDMPQGIEYTLDNKDKFLWTLMIMQPGFVTSELFGDVCEEQKKKKGGGVFDKLRLETYEEGLCCQMMHIGPYDAEPASIERMMKYCDENGWRRLEKSHREVYLTDARRTSPDKLKTILRFKIEESVKQ